MSIAKDVTDKAWEAARRLNLALSELDHNAGHPGSNYDRLMSIGQLADAEWVITLRHEGVSDESIGAVEWLERGQEDREKFFAKFVHRVLIAERRKAEREKAKAE